MSAKAKGLLRYETLKPELSTAEPGHGEIPEPINHRGAAASKLTLIKALLIFTPFGGGFFGSADKGFHSSPARLHRDSRGVSLIQGC